MNIYLDDERTEPPDYVRVKTSKECIDYLIVLHESGQVCHSLSLDHDLGDGNGTGYDVVCWLEEMFYSDEKFILPIETKVHSANPVGRKRMLQVIEKLYFNNVV